MFIEETETLATRAIDEIEMQPDVEKVIVLMIDKKGDASVHGTFCVECMGLTMLKAAEQLFDLDKGCGINNDIEIAVTLKRIMKKFLFGKA